MISLLLLMASHWLMSGNLDYVLILVATSFLGTGFGLAVTAQNPFAYALFPEKGTTALTGLHALMSFGATAAPLVLSFFVELDSWWLAPSLIAIFLVVITIFSSTITLSLPKADSTQVDTAKSSGIPFRVWLYVIVVFCYGACEATFGNYGSVFLEKETSFTVAKASTGLSLVWAGVAIGRIAFALLALKLSTKWIYIIVPFILTAVLFFLPSFTNETLLFGGMLLGGLSLSFLFPNTIGSATEEYPEQAALISGVLVAALQLGTGFASYVIGYLSDATRENPLSLGSLFQFSASYALLIALLVLFLMNTKVKIDK